MDQDPYLAVAKPRCSVGTHYWCILLRKYRHKAWRQAHSLQGGAARPRFFQNHNIRNLIDKQSKIILEIKDDEGRFGPKFNDNESELYFYVVGVIKDKNRLKNLFDLFIEVINEFESIGITLNQTPDVKLYKI